MDTKAMILMPVASRTHPLLPLVAFSVTLFSAALSLSAESKALFLEVDPHNTTKIGDTPQAAYARRIEAAVNLPEARPSDLDPEGNWGSLVEGIQLSVRFDKTDYVTGEPIRARVILRNVSAKTLSMAGREDFDGVTLTAIDENGNPAPKRPKSKGPLSIFGGAGNHVLIPAQEQFTYHLKMESFYSLTNPGVYFVTAWIGRPQHIAPRPDQIDTSSANAMIRILAPDQAGGSAGATAAHTPFGSPSPTSASTNAGRVLTTTNLAASHSSQSPSKQDDRSSTAVSGPASVTPPASPSNLSAPAQFAVTTPASDMTAQERLGIGIITAILAAIAFILFRRRNPGRSL